MKVVYLHGADDGCGFWRMFEPAKWLNKQYGGELSVYTHHLTGASDEACEELHQKINECDFVVSQRVSSPEQAVEFAKIREALHKPIVFETDDDFANIPPESSAYKHWAHNGKPYAAAAWQFSWCDAYQTSTRFLAGQMKRGIEGNKPIWVNPNLIDIEAWDALRAQMKPRHDPSEMIKIGWASGFQKAKEVAEFKDIVKRIAEEYPDKVMWVMRGMVSPYLSPLSERCVIPNKDMIDFHYAGNYPQWPTVLASMDCDFAFAYLSDDIFNRSKSSCRFLEYAAAGYAGIYSPVEPYSNTVKDGVTGLLPKDNSPEAWYRAFKRLIEEPNLRADLGAAANEWVRKNRSLQNNIGIWKKSLDEMYAYFKGDWKFKSASECGADPTQNKWLYGDI